MQLLIRYLKEHVYCNFLIELKLGIGAFVLRDFVVHFELHLHLGVWSFFREQTRIPIGDVLALLTDIHEKNDRLFGKGGK
jgi:hypothetical protein